MTKCKLVSKQIRGYKFPVQRVQQGDRDFFIGVLDSYQINSLAYVEVLCKDNMGKGLQRDAIPKHVSNMKTAFQTNQIIPHCMICTMRNGTHIVKEHGKYFVVTPAKTGKYLHVTDGNNRRLAAAAFAADTKEKPIQLSVAFCQYVSDLDEKVFRARLSMNTKKENTTCMAFLLWQGKKYLSASWQAAGDLLYRADNDPDSLLYGRVCYVHRLPKAEKALERIRFNECIEKLSFCMRDVDEFADSSQDNQYRIFNAAIDGWAEANASLWDDHHAYMISRRFGLMCIILTMPYVLKKTLQQHGKMTPDLVKGVIANVSKKLDRNTFLGSAYGVDFQSRDSFKSKAVNAMDIESGKDEQGKKVYLHLADPRVEKVHHPREKHTETLAESFAGVIV